MNSEEFDSPHGKLYLTMVKKGLVQDHQRISEVEVLSKQESSITLDGEAAQDLKVSSTNVMQTRTFIKADDGREIFFELTDMDLPIRQGHHVSLIFLSKDQNSLGELLDIRIEEIARSYRINFVEPILGEAFSQESTRPQGCLTGFVVFVICSYLTWKFAGIWEEYMMLALLTGLFVSSVLAVISGKIFATLKRRRPEAKSREFELRRANEQIELTEKRFRDRLDVLRSELGLEKPADYEILSLLATGNKIEAIKLYRNETGLSLKAAKDTIDHMIDSKTIKR